jgi:hypothetical protein
MRYGNGIRPRVDHRLAKPRPSELAALAGRQARFGASSAMTASVLPAATDVSDRPGDHRLLEGFNSSFLSPLANAARPAGAQADDAAGIEALYRFPCTSVRLCTQIKSVLVAGVRE